MTTLGTPTPLATMPVTPMLDGSKLYALTRSRPLLEFLIPDINTQMAVELKIEEIFPRVELDGDATRILINFTTKQGDESLYKINNVERLDRRFDIDHFMNGFVKAMDEVKPSDMAMDPIDAHILAAFNMATIITMGLATGDDMTVSARIVGEIAFKSITSILFDDPLDVMVMITEAKEPDEFGEPKYIVTNLWRVKERRNPEETEVDEQATTEPTPQPAADDKPEDTTG